MKTTLLTMAFVATFMLPGAATAGMISFEMTGRFNLDVVDGGGSDGDYDVRLIFTIDDATADSLPYDGGAGGFVGGTTLISITPFGTAPMNALDLDSVVATNINAIFQRSTQMHVAEGTNLYTLAIGIPNFPAGPIVDPNVLAPLATSPISGAFTGSGTLWQLSTGDTFRINNALTQVQISNFSTSSAVPEPSSLLLLGGTFLIACSSITIRRRMAV